MPNPIFVTGIAVAAVFYIAVSLQYSFSSRLVSFFSDISYSVYLVHYPIILWVARKVQDGYLAALVAWVIIILVSWSSYLAIEKPFVRLGRHLSARRSFGHEKTVL